MVPGPGFVVDDLPASELMEAIPDGVVLVDAEGTIVGANTQALHLFGYDWDDLGGRSVDDLVPERLRGRHARHRRHYEKHPEPRPMGPDRRLFAQRKDGSTFQAEISLSPLHSGDHHLVVAVVRDVTQRIVMEKRLDEALQRLQDLV